MESHEIEGLVGELETRVDRLRALYEQYFMGIEKMAPAVPQKDVERRIQVLRKEQIRNTAVRFRFQMILQRYNVYQTHWIRICRQIEEGTYKRDLLRAQRRFGAKPSQVAPVESKPSQDALVRVASPTPAQPLASAKPADSPAAGKGTLPKAPPVPAKPLPLPAKPPPLPAKAQAPPSPAANKTPTAQAQVVPARAPPPLPARAAKPAPAQPDLSEDRLRQIYSEYVQSRQTQKESTAALTYDAMARNLRESSQKLKEKHGKFVDFEVTVKDGKTILRPVVKR